MANASKQIVTQSLVLNKHPLTFTQLPTSEGTLPNANEGIRHRLFAFAVPFKCTHFRQTNAVICHLFGVRLVYVYTALRELSKGTNMIRLSLSHL